MRKKINSQCFFYTLDDLHYLFTFRSIVHVRQNMLHHIQEPVVLVDQEISFLFVVL